LHQFLINAWTEGKYTHYSCHTAAGNEDNNGDDVMMMMMMRTPAVAVHVV